MSDEDHVSNEHGEVADLLDAAKVDQDVSRETLPKRTIGQIFEPEPVEVDEQAAARQAELDDAAAKMRAEDTKRLTAAEFANYEASHAIIEPEQAEEAAQSDDDEKEV